MSGCDRVDHLGRVGEQPLELLVGRLLVDEGDLLDVGLFCRSLPTLCDLVVGRGGIEEHDELDATLPALGRVADALAHHHREPDEEQRHRDREHVAMLMVTLRTRLLAVSRAT